MTKYYVITGNYDEFIQFAICKFGEYEKRGFPISTSDFVYVHSENTILGVENPTGWLYGTWRQKPGIKYILETLITHKRDGKNVGPLKKILEDIRNGS
jgi:hypothetical protein